MKYRFICSLMLPLLLLSSCQKRFYISDLKYNSYKLTYRALAYDEGKMYKSKKKDIIDFEFVGKCLNIYKYLLKSDFIDVEGSPNDFDYGGINFYEIDFIGEYSTSLFFNSNYRAYLTAYNNNYELKLISYGKLDDESKKMINDIFPSLEKQLKNVEWKYEI